MTSYDETSETKKFLVKDASSYKDVEVKFHYLTTSLDISETRFSKLKMTDSIWLFLLLKNISIFLQLSQVNLKTLPQGFLKRC